MRREIAQASQCFLKAIEIFVAIYKNKFHPNISYCYTSLAMLYCSEQDMRKAVEYQTETVAILNQVHTLSIILFSFSPKKIPDCRTQAKF